MDYKKIAEESRALRNKYNNAELMAIITDLNWYINQKEDAKPRTRKESEG